MGSMAMAAAIMFTAAMLAAFMIFTVMFVMMAAAGFGIIVQFVVEECFYSCVCFALNAAEDADAGTAQCDLCTASDTAADKGVYAQCDQHGSQQAVAGAFGAYDGDI